MRPQIDISDIDAILAKVREEWVRRLDEKGCGIFMTKHEIVGVLVEEHQELLEDLRDNDRTIEQELLDNAVVIVHGLASLNSGKMEW